MFTAPAQQHLSSETTGSASLREATDNQRADVYVRILVRVPTFRGVPGGCCRHLAVMQLHGLILRLLDLPLVLHLLILNPLQPQAQHEHPVKR